MEKAIREALGKAVYATWQSRHPQGATLPWAELDEDWQELEQQRAEVAVMTYLGTLDAEQLAEFFHTTYEALAPKYGYETRPATAKSWSEIPEDNNNKRLMIAVCAEVVQKFFADKETP